MFVVSMNRTYVLLTAMQTLEHIASQVEEEYYNGWKPIK
jgi:hypothetical protein